MQYVPILKAKEGEYKALRSLSTEQKTTIFPILEVTNLPFDYEEEKPTRTADEHIAKFCENIAKSWDPKLPFGVDFPESIAGAVLANGDNPLADVAMRLRKAGYHFVPVVDSEKPTSYVAAAAAAIAEDRHGACLRLSSDDFGTDVAASIEKILAGVGIPPAEIDLVIDFKAILPDQENTIVLAVQGALDAIPHLGEWRSVIFAASSFPKDLGGFGPGSINTTPRTEWLVWQTIIENKKVSRPIIYGDYTIAHPEIVEIDPRIMEMSASIRYACPEYWLVLKGRSVKKNGYGQFVELAKTLIGRSEFAGRSFSKGDEGIADCAAGKSGPGNATTWRSVGVSHHITLALDQISRHAP
jgi:hypothetical protein